MANNDPSKSICPIAPGQVNFALGIVKMEVWWLGEQVKLASIALLVDKGMNIAHLLSKYILLGAAED